MNRNNGRTELTDPYIRINNYGKITDLGLEHELLGKSSLDLCNTFPKPPREFGSVGLDFYTTKVPHETILVENIDTDNPQHSNHLADRFVEFCKLFFKRLRPEIGSVDLMGSNFYETYTPASINRLKWRMYFGAEAVESLGRQYLSRVPCVVYEETSEGAILFGTERDYSTWHSKQYSQCTVDAVEYLRERFPAVHVYIQEEVDIPPSVSRIIQKNTDGVEVILYDKKLAQKFRTI
ncbi:MAG: hypothetical protein ACRC8S_03185 [Fimbriiglobus sp.]